MSKLAAIQALADQAAATGIDMTEVQKGGGGRLLPEGYAFGRLVEYIELGSQPQEYNGVAKEPAPECAIAFALYGQGYQNDDGTPYIIRPFSFALGRNEKSKAFKLFKALNWKGTAKNFAQLVGQAYLVKIMHVKGKDAAAKVTSRIDFDGFLPPLDPVTKQPYAIPEAREEDLQLFMWDYPSKEAWDALFVPGNWDDGKSKNRTQETIMAALDFQGSPLQQLVFGALSLPAGLPVGLPVAPTTPALPIAPVAPAVAPAPFVPAAVSVPASPVEPSTGTPSAGIALPTISPSSPALPSLPSLPALPSLPQ